MRFTMPRKGGSLEANTMPIPVSGCWIWLGKWGKTGYGRVAVGGGKHVQAHRAMWESTFGAIPDGMLVLHKCDTRSCINPGHLFLGSQADNVRDMIEKGRKATSVIFPRRTTLTALQVDEIRRIGLAESRASIGRKYGVSGQAIGQILLGRTWVGN